MGSRIRAQDYRQADFGKGVCKLSESHRSAELFCKAASCMMCGKRVVRSSQNWRGSGAEVVESRRCSQAGIAEQLPNNSLQNERFGANEVVVTLTKTTEVNQCERVRVN